jgi:hypothetical protein
MGKQDSYTILSYFEVKSMKSVFQITFVFIAICCTSSDALNKSFVWSDEFNYTDLPDSTQWEYDTGGPAGAITNLNQEFGKYGQVEYREIDEPHKNMEK